VIKKCGKTKQCAKALKPTTGGSTAAAAPKKEEKKEAKKDDSDDMGLFDDDEDDGEAAKAAAAAAKASSTKKVKKPVIAQSLVMFEIKPFDSDTNLDTLAKKILDIKWEAGGLYWKTQYRKEPIAYGIEKLIIGVTVEDEKVSVDAL